MTKIRLDWKCNEKINPGKIAKIRNLVSLLLVLQTKRVRFREIVPESSGVLLWETMDYFYKI